MVELHEQLRNEFLKTYVRKHIPASDLLDDGPDSSARITPLLDVPSGNQKKKAKRNSNIPSSVNSSLLDDALVSPTVSSDANCQSPGIASLFLQPTKKTTIVAEREVE